RGRIHRCTIAQISRRIFGRKPGKHTLRFEHIGRNPLSKGDQFGLDSVRLRERWLKKRKLLG
ncbi:MAG TPA: hypothetical protein VE398_16355, partial [Acidobacteriota bacterium]|nr:hypothetical protein [Acidobacteriota bacterium]